MKSMIKLIITILLSLILTSCNNTVPIVENNEPSPQVTLNEESSVPSLAPTPLITEKALTHNQIAHTAYEDAMRNGQLSEIRELAAEYLFYDIDNDGIDELIAYPAAGCDTYWIYNFLEGNINELMGIGQAWSSLTIYPEKSAFSFIGTGNMGYYIDFFYELKNGRAYVVAEKESHEIYEPYGDGSYISVGTNDFYTVNDKEATETAYKEAIKALCTGKQVKHEDMQWYRWINPEGTNFYNRLVDQSNETETHYFRFDSGADNTIIFRFIIDSDYAKLQSMKITLCDLDLKPALKTDSFGAFEQMDYECTISEEGGYYLRVISEFEKKSNYNDYRDNLYYKVFISDTGEDG